MNSLDPATPSYERPASLAPYDAPVAWVFGPLTDRLLHLRRADRVAFLDDVRAVLRRFPKMAGLDRRALLRAIAAADAANRVILRLGLRVPWLAKVLSYTVPIAGARERFRAVPTTQPIIVALMHFGPIHFVVAITLRLMYGRRLYVLHAGGEFGEPVHRYLARIGSIPLLTNRETMDAVKAEIARDPNCAVLVAFDHLHGRRRRSVPFLGGELSAPTGLAYLANETSAAVITVWWEFAGLFPSVRVGETYGVDLALGERERRDDLHDRMFRVLEERVLAAPGMWTEWANCSEA